MAFPLSCSAQCYAWGRIGSDSTVAALLSATPGYLVDETSPYAELWMGSHPKAPSTVHIPLSPLDDAVRAQGRTTAMVKDNGGSPEELAAAAVVSGALYNHAACVPVDLGLYLARGRDSVLGKGVQSQFGGLPFLFKVLSVNKALSIQAHPNKELAGELHARDPGHYPDANHKPEMAIALTEFEAMCSFRPVAEIVEFLNYVPSFRGLIGEEAAAALESESAGSLKAAFTALMTAPADAVASALAQLEEQVNSNNANAPAVVAAVFPLTLRLFGQYPGDVGIFCPFFLNYLTLQPGEALFLSANEPHAYLSGDCAECMAASDNVVRAGLTPKFRDVDVLCDMLTYEARPAESVLMEPKQESPNAKLYSAPVPEFDVRAITLGPGESASVEATAGPSILLTLSGTGALLTSATMDSVATPPQRVDHSYHRGYVKGDFERVFSPVGRTKTALDVYKGAITFVVAGAELELTAGPEGLTVFQAHSDGTVTDE